jgi:hypothetical protein
MRADRHVIVFPEGDFSSVRADVLAAAPLEASRFVLVHPVRTPAGNWRLLSYRTMEPLAADYLDQSNSSIKLSPRFVGEVLQAARTDGAGVLMLHSHPFPGVASPSSVDLNGEQKLVPALQKRVPNVPHGRVIVSPTSTHCALFLDGNSFVKAKVVEVGRSVVSWEEHDHSNVAADGGQYDRQVRAFGAAGQERLATLRVAIVGLGGTGSVVAQQLAHLGVRNFVLIDPDNIEVTNLNRLVGSSLANVGVPKVMSADQMIRGVQPDAIVSALKEDIRDVPTVRRLLDVDFFFCCTDSQGSRAVLNQFAYQYLVPGIDIGVAIDLTKGRDAHISARVQMLSAGLACLVCGEILDPEAVRRDLLSDEARRDDRYIIGGTVLQPSVISINSIAASHAVTMFLAAVTGIPVTSRHQRLRIHAGISSHIHVNPNPACYVCAPSAAFGRGDSWPTPGRVRADRSGEPSP